jgi:anti-anti-sigma regulatory factor
MLRINVAEDAGLLTFRLEGRLTGQWVSELEACWRQSRDKDPIERLRFDLSQVTSIDTAGKSFLAARHTEGAELIASCCLMRAVVAEIAGKP